MSVVKRLCLSLFGVMLLGCGSDSVQPEPPEPEPTSCEDPLAVATPSGACLRPGIAPDGCGEGFLHDGAYGCEPVLPSERCPPKTMALPGEEVCRPVMECPTGKWGGIPTEPTTQFVDAGYGGTELGTEQQPWSTISAAVAAASPGAVVAVAAGTYSENVAIADKALRVNGVCPAQVTISGTMLAAPGCPPAALCVTGALSSGTEVSGVSLTGLAGGIVTSGATDLIIDRAVIHDVGERGIDIEDDLGPSSMILRDSLIENATSFGLFLVGASATVERSTIRGTQAAPGMPALGEGVVLRAGCDAPTVQACDPSRLSSLSLVRSIIEDNHTAGVEGQIGGLIRIEDSVIRGTRPNDEGKFGRGVNHQRPCEGEPILGPFDCNYDIETNLVMERSLLEDNHDAGVFLGGATFELRSTVIRRTAPLPSNDEYGVALLADFGCTFNAGGAPCDPRARTNGTVRSSLFEDNHEFSVFTIAADLLIEDTVIRRTAQQPSTLRWGSGIQAQGACFDVFQPAPCDPGRLSATTVRRSLLEEHLGFGAITVDGAMSIESSVVRATATTTDGMGTPFFGDGLVIAGPGAPSALSVLDVSVEESARAGLAAFGATLAVGNTSVTCADIDLVGEAMGGVDPIFENVGGNRCGCPSAASECKLVSAGLAPPTAQPKE